MSDKCFVDTNILVYAHDLTKGAKHERARALIEKLWDTGGGVLSTQVLQELCISLRRKTARPLSVEETRSLAAQTDAKFLENLCAQYPATGIPELFDQRSRPFVFRSLAEVVGVHQNVGVNKALIAHAVRRANGELSSPDPVLRGAAPQPAFERDHIPYVLARVPRAWRQGAG